MIQWIATIALWLLYSVTLYGFFYLVRELFRTFSIGIHYGNPLLILNQQELFVYNLFFAAMAAAIGYTFAVKFLLEVTQYQQNLPVKRPFRHAITTLAFIAWVFLMWFARVGSSFGIFHSQLSLQYEIDLLTEFPIFLLLLPIVLLLASWPVIRKVFGFHNPNLALLSLLGTFSIFSLALSSINFINVDKVNEVLTPPFQAYQLELPVSHQSQVKIGENVFISRIWITEDTVLNNDPKIFVNDISIDSGELPRFLYSEKISLPEFYHPMHIPTLLIDRDIPYPYVKKIKSKIKDFGIRQVLLTTTQEIDISKVKYLADQGLYQQLAEPDSTLEDNNIINIVIKPDLVALNSKAVQLPELASELYSIIKATAPHYIISIEIDKLITHQRYIEVMDYLYIPIISLRNELSLELYREPYGYWGSRNWPDTLFAAYPDNIVEEIN